MLRSIAPTLAYSGVDPGKVKLLGTGLWYDLSITREPALKDGWFAAPAARRRRDLRRQLSSGLRRRAAAAGRARLRCGVAGGALGAGPALSPLLPAAALVDPNGFAGVDGIFRFGSDGAIDRGLAILSIEPGGFHVVSPAPATFQSKGS